eukprot:s799_g22.t1
MRSFQQQHICGDMSVQRTEVNMSFFIQSSLVLKPQAFPFARIVATVHTPCVTSSAMSGMALADLNKQIRNVRERLKRSQRSTALDSLPAPGVVQAALMVYTFSWNNLDIAARFLLWRLGTNESDLEEMCCLMEKIYTNTPNPQILQLTTDECLERK